MTTSTKVELPVELDHDHRRHVLGGEPVILHCHHYNTFLQRSIQDASYIDSRPFLVGAAAEVSAAQSAQLQAVLDGADPREVAAAVYAWAGFGQVELGGISGSGGSVTAPSSHYGSAWRTKFGQATEPVDVFTTGWLSGVAGTAAGGPVEVAQAACIAVGDAIARFELTAAPGGAAPPESVGVGPLREHDPVDTQSGNVDYEGIYDALVNMAIEGDDQGLIPAFGVYLTHHYANYYNRISFEFERAMEDKFGKDGLAAARPLLVEAGHVCAFNTFGGIMSSPEWDALIRPSLSSQEDWVDGITAAVNALGWGRWSVSDHSAESAVFTLQDDYESVGYLAMYGQTDHSVSYLAEGAAMGIMNLVYRGDIPSKPELTAGFYDTMFKNADSYQAETLTSLAMGDATTTIFVHRPS